MAEDNSVYTDLDVDDVIATNDTSPEESTKTSATDNLSMKYFYDTIKNIKEYTIKTDSGVMRDFGVARDTYVPDEYKEDLNIFYGGKSDVEPLFKLLIKYKHIMQNEKVYCADDRKENIKTQYMYILNGLLWGYIESQGLTLDKFGSELALIQLDAKSPLRSLKSLSNISEGVTTLEGLYKLVQVGMSLVEGNYSGVDNKTLEQTVSDILNVFDDLYAPCYIEKPLGILTSQGVIRFDGNGFVKDKDSITYVNNICRETGYLTIIKESNSNILNGSTENILKVLNTDVNYLVEFHAKLVMGYNPLSKSTHRVESWSEMKQNLKTELTDLFRVFLSSAENMTALKIRLFDLFTNCFIVNSLDVTDTMSFTYKCSENYPLAEKVAKNIKSLFGVNDSAGQKIISTETKRGVHIYSYAFNAELYKDSILFAYERFEKIIKAGGTVSTKNCVLGRAMDGQDFEINLDDPGRLSTFILAGSRSGKGVLTLTILATMVASGNPFIYLDYKPDMAGILWDLDRKYNVPILAIDGAMGKTDYGCEAVREYPFKYKVPYQGMPDALSTLPYIKAIQLAVLLAKLTSKGDISLHKKKFFVISDELEQMNKAYSKLGDWLLDQMKELKPSKKEEPTPEYLFYKKLYTVFYKNFESDITDLLNTYGGKARVGCLSIGQNGDPGAWDRGAISTLIQRATTKIIGRNAGNSETYGLTGAKFTGYETIAGGSRGYFACYHSAKRPSDDLIKCFKSYLVLNDNDVDTNPSGYVNTLLDNIENERVRKHTYETKIFNDGVKNDRVGFIGLMEYLAANLGTDVPKGLSSGYVILWELLKHIGLDKKYSCVEEYLFDCSAIYSLDELASGTFNTNISVGSSDNEDIAQDYEYSDLYGAEAVYDNSSIDFGDDIDSCDDIDSRDNIDSCDNIDSGVVTSKVDDVDSQENNHVGEPDEFPQYTPPKSSQNATSEVVANHVIDINPYDVAMLFESEDSTQYYKDFQFLAEKLLEDIKKQFKGATRITSIRVYQNNMLEINKVKYKPQLPQKLISKLPLDMKANISSGNVADLFNFYFLKEFRHLQMLVIDDIYFAEGKIRTEYGLQGDWNSLFKKMPNLMVLKIGGKNIDANVKMEDTKTYEGFKLGSSLRKAFKLPYGGNSAIGRFYKSDKVPTFIKFAATMGVGLAGLAVVTNPVGILGATIGSAFSLHKKLKD